MRQSRKTDLTIHFVVVAFIVALALLQLFF